MSPTERFFAYARERERIRLLKESGAPRPWTTDPILNHHRFCNIRREDDRVTRWFRENVREPQRNDPRVVLNTVAFRWFNRITTGELLLQAGVFEQWDHRVVRATLAGRNPIVTGAYMVKTPPGLNKLEGVISVVERFIDLGLSDRVWHDCKTLFAAWNVIMSSPYMGRFMAYEVVTDLRWTLCLENAKDIMTWANPGPGAMRGLDRIAGDDLWTRQKRIAHYWDQMQEEMQALLEISKDPKHWPREWGAWEMREVEHTLCEFDKYERVRLGQGRPKKKYREGAEA